MTLAEYQAELLAEKQAEIAEQEAAGYYDRWFDFGWCGRLDLAEKLLNQTSARNCCNARIVKVGE